MKEAGSLLKIMTEHQSHSGAAWPNATARDDRVSVAELIALALIQEFRDNNDDQEPRALLVLQAKADEDSASAALDLLMSPDPARRRLGAQIAREFPRLDAAPNQWSPRFLVALETAIATEDDESALRDELSAMAWQKLSKATSVLLRFAGHPSERIRHTVANNLILTCDCTRELPSEVLGTLSELSRDTSPDVRESVFYDVAQFPTLFASRSVDLINAARDSIRLHGPGEQFATEAIRALELQRERT